jgi:hypothetical protein
MRWLSSFALMLFLNLWCTPQAFAVHDSRLSPLADTQFHAVTPQLYCHQFNIEADSSDEPQHSLNACPARLIQTVATAAISLDTQAEAQAPLRYRQPRAPPVTP